MKKFLSFVFTLFFGFSLMANTTSPKVANRKTALRYLQLAKNYVTQNDWNSVKKACENGIQYDSEIADLYYLSALSLFNLQHPRYEILPVVQQSLNGAEWVDYNMTNARVFYADLLCQTGEPVKALAVLDKAPLIYSADAEYVRIKSLFELNTSESITKAEEKIESARRVYPNDVRFFYLFFNYEYNLIYVSNENKTGFDKVEPSPLAKKIAASFIANVPNYDKNYKDLEILSSFFAEGETKKRLLKAFNARGFNHILYPIAALEAEIISEEEALDYFLTFIDEEIEEKLLVQFYSIIKDENLKRFFDEHLNGFKGTLVYDTNNTLEANLIVKYSRGRAVEVSYDANNDEFIEWKADCDFGEPKTLIDYSENAYVIYGNYPYVRSVAFSDPETGSDGAISFNIIDENFITKPFEIITAPEVASVDFYVIDAETLVSGKPLFDTESIVLSANIMTKKSLERPGAKIEFAILNGIPYKATYYVADKIYASAQFFDETICVVRAVDKNDDGIFETTEYYSSDDKGMELSQTEKDAVTTNIWGNPVENASMYLYKIQIDTNLDTVSDFEETYFPREGKVSTWDSDFDGTTDIIYQKFSKELDRPVREDQSYYINDVVKGKFWVTVKFEDGVPVMITEDEVEHSVIQGSNKNFFWIEKQESAGYEMNILGQISLYENAQCFQLDEAECYIKVIKVGQNIFAKKIIKEKITDNSLNEVEE